MPGSAARSLARRAGTQAELDRRVRKTVSPASSRPGRGWPVSNMRSFLHSKTTRLPGGPWSTGTDRALPSWGVSQSRRVRHSSSPEGHACELRVEIGVKTFRVQYHREARTGSRKEVTSARWDPLPRHMLSGGYVGAVSEE